MDLLNKDGRALTGKLLPDEIRLLIALSRMSGDQVVEGIIDGIAEHTGKKQDELYLVLNSLGGKDFLQNCETKGARITTKGWNFIQQFKEELKKEKLLKTRIANG